MQIFEFELIDQTVTTPEAALAPILASARAVESEPLLEHEGLALAQHLNLAVTEARPGEPAARSLAAQVNA